MDKDVINKIKEAIKISKGTFAFRYFSEDLMNKNLTGGIIFEENSGSHIFRLERTSDFLLKFYYSSTGIKTKVASIDLNKSINSNMFQIIFTWSPEEINLYFGALTEGGELLSGNGEICDFKLRVDKNGKIYQIGDKNIEIMNLNIYEEGKKVLSSTAIESWCDTKEALRILNGGISEEGFIYENILSNITISTLVTGFEVYSKKRILELEEEGFVPAEDGIIKVSFSNNDKEKGLIEVYKKEAEDRNISFLSFLINEKRRINFQDYDDCKKSFLNIYNIKFDSIGVKSDFLHDIKNLIAFRHQIIHVSLLASIINQSNVPLEKPIFSDKKLATEALNTFDLFINKLHEATLKKHN